MLKRTIYSLAIVALIAGCSSGTKLNDTPVTDGRGTAGQQGGGASTVTPVNADQNAGTMQGPVGVARIVYFDYDSYTVKDEFRSVVEAHAKYLNSHKDRKVIIQGNTDDRGGTEYNLALGQKRAEAVRKALVLLGVSDAQVEAVSFGKEKPKALGSDEAAWAENRRSDIAYQ